MDKGRLVAVYSLSRSGVPGMRSLYSEMVSLVYADGGS